MEDNPKVDLCFSVLEAISLMESVPVSSFRKPYAREFFEIERIPPPATVYGFLL
jgi:CRISPR-associated Cas5-like protein